MKRCREGAEGPIIASREGVVGASARVYYGDAIVRMVRPAGVAAGFVVSLLLLNSGCQKGRSGAAGPKVETPSTVAAAAGQAQVGTPTAEAPRPVMPEAQKERAALPGPSETGPAVELALRFAVGQVATYRITTEAQKSVEWMGAPAAKPASFKDGRTGNHIEMTFEQRVQEVHEDGGATVEITIQALKYVGESQNNVVLDFDSARDKDPAQPLARLMGKSYRLHLSARGQVLALIDLEPVRQAVKSDQPGGGVALKLLSDEEVKSRHEIPPLSALKDVWVRPGQTWSNIKSYSFGMMGAKSYERVYTLQRAGQKDGLAVVDMKAIPSSAMAEQIHKQESGGSFSRMFDNTENYEGRLEFDRHSGSVRECVEQMQTEWVMADPAGEQEGGRPAALKMAARQSLRLEQVP